MGDERRVAIALSVVAAATTAVTWALGWWSLPTDVRASSVVLAALSPVAMSAVLLAAAWLLARGRRLAGAVALWTVVAMMAPGLVVLPRQLIEARGAAIGLGLLGMVGTLAVVGAALLVRRHLAWSQLSRARTHRGVVVAGVVVTLGLILPKVVHHPVGRPWQAGEATWRPEFLTAHGLVDVVVFLLAPLTLLGVLVLAARIHPPYAGVAILAAIVPSVAGDLGILGMAFEQADLRATPVAWLSLAAHLVLLALAVRWATSEGTRHEAEPVPRTEPQLG